MVLSEVVCVFQGLRPTQAVQGPVGGPDKELVGRAQRNDEVSTSTNISHSQLKPVAVGLAYVPCPCLLLSLFAFFLLLFSSCENLASGFVSTVPCVL